MKTITSFLILLFSVMGVGSFAQELKQSIHGTVTDEQTGIAIPGATILLVGSNPVLGTTTSLDGYFTLENVPIGRQTIQISFIGYQPATLKDLEVTSGKALNLNVSLLESTTNLDEVVIKAESSPEKAINEMAIVSARSFTLEEATRYAGAFNDPARMAANFAGVTSSADLRNDIIVRGNSPNAIAYRIDGINTPNPNHFGSYGGSGGAISMLSQNILDKSDFLTGAFPAEFGNAIGGAFDIKFRNGNHHDREYSAQFGFRGLEFTAEGPFSKNGRGSYLVNYRYSTFEVLDAFGFNIGVPATPAYQDLSYKIDMPTGKKIGRFSLFGLGGTANINLKDSDIEDPEEYFNLDKPADIFNETRMFITGLSNFHILSPKTTGNLTLAYAHSNDIFDMDTLQAPNFKTGYLNADGDFREDRFSTAYKLKHKVNAKNLIISGFNGSFSNLDFIQHETIDGKFKTTTDHSGTMNTYQVYADWQHRFSEKFIVNTGLHYQYFDLTESQSIEPRLGAKWQVNEIQSFNAGFGMHSQPLVPYAYFVTQEKEDGTLEFKNRNLDLMRSIHYVLGYERLLNENLRFKVETYYQSLYDIPVEKTPSTFSAINTGNDFEGFPTDLDQLENSGTGINYGLELSFERFFAQQFYYMVNSSFFKSSYEGSDKVERSTAFDQGYVFNLLGGKEWNVGKNKTNVFGINGRVNWTGGRRFTPINKEASQELKEIVEYENKAFSEKQTDYFRMDFKVSYTINKPKLSHKISIDIQNLTNNQNVFQENYNITNNSFTTEYQQGFIPELQYKITF